MGESDLDQLISPVYSNYTNPVTTILAGAGDIQVHLRARCATAEEAERVLAEVGPPIEELLGDRLYSRNGEPLEGVVGDDAAGSRRDAERGRELHRRIASGGRITDRRGQLGLAFSSADSWFIPIK